MTNEKQDFGKYPGLEETVNKDFKKLSSAEANIFAGLYNKATAKDDNGVISYQKPEDKVISAMAKSVAEQAKKYLLNKYLGWDQKTIENYMKLEKAKADNGGTSMLELLLSWNGIDVTEKHVKSLISQALQETKGVFNQTALDIVTKSLVEPHQKKTEENLAAKLYPENPGEMKQAQEYITARSEGKIKGKDLYDPRQVTSYALQVANLPKPSKN